MDVRNASPNSKAGRFLWMDEKAKKRYLSELQRKIGEGYFSSEQILVKIVDEMAPVFSDYIDGDMPDHSLKGYP